MEDSTQQIEQRKHSLLKIPIEIELPKVEERVFFNEVTVKPE